MKQTSETHPLWINPVSVPGTPGVIGMTLCPGKVQRSALSGHWERDLATDLRAIQDWGASMLVTLMESAELAAFKVGTLPEEVPQGMEHFLLPIVDGWIPDAGWEREWARAGAKIRTALAAGAKVVIHCRGGLGRTGTVAARLLVEFGMGPGEAIAAVRKARPGAIENTTQEDYVRRQKPVVPLAPRPYHRIPPDRASRFRGCLLGGAVGDALGAPVEFMDLTAIRKRFGLDGIRNLAPAYGRLGAITDDTQMTLFTAEGVLRSHVRSAGLGPTSLPGIVGHAYLRWLASQEVEGRAEGIGRDGWLFGHRELFSPRAPGNTCLSALAAREGVGDATPASNRSKGCGGVMRVAPAGLYAASLGLSPEQAFAWGCEVSALTHGHPSGQLPGGALALVIGEMVRGRSLPAAVALAKDSLRRQTAHEETLAAVLAAESLAAASPAEEALPQLGQGWVAEEALAIALFCALRAVNLEEGVIMAANITGDSDSTAAITGNILGAMLGVHEIPDRWLAQLELREVITEMADDLASVADWAIGESNPGTPAQEREQAYWARRYPGW